MDIELADAVAAVRAQLLDAAARSAGNDLAFAVGPIEMEFAVELRTDAKAKAGFKAWVVSAEAAATVGWANTHRVKIVLTPKQADGADLLIGADTDASFGLPRAAGHIGR